MLETLQQIYVWQLWQLWQMPAKKKTAPKKDKPILGQRLVPPDQDQKNLRELIHDLVLRSRSRL